MAGFEKLKSAEGKLAFREGVIESNRTLLPGRDLLKESFPKDDGAELIYNSFMEVADNFTSMKSEVAVVTAFIMYSLLFNEMELDLFLLPDLVSLIEESFPGMLNEDELSVFAAHLQIFGTFNMIKNAADK